ncbi:MAG: hypothetical protein MHMPM18_003770 [Marteilia pararefringens]
MLREKASSMTKQRYQDGAKILDWTYVGEIGSRGFYKDLRFPTNNVINHCKYLIYSTVACAAHCESETEARHKCNHKLRLLLNHCHPIILDEYREKFETGSFRLADVANSDLYLDFDDAPIGFQKFSEDQQQ